MKKRILSSIPWLITAAALYFAFSGIKRDELGRIFGEANPVWVLGAVLLTCSSYFLRAYRWEFFFPATQLAYFSSLKVLILGFFMNNVLPARTGELVRAHMGAKVTKEKRTLVLATVASERLVDGLVISIMFAVLAGGIGDPTLSHEFSYVAIAFGLASLTVLTLVALRRHFFRLVEALAVRLNFRGSAYAFNRLQVFVEGLSPLSDWRRLLPIAVSSFCVWFTELAVYVCVTEAFQVPGFTLAHWVLFMVAVNFSSLIPAAPGGIGVIEAVATQVLLSLNLGITRELALAMVLCQHIIQYVVVGVPGLLIWLSWRKVIFQLDDALV